MAKEIPVKSETTVWNSGRSAFFITISNLPQKLTFPSVEMNEASVIRKSDRYELPVAESPI